MASAGSSSMRSRASRVLQQDSTDPPRSTTSSGESKTQKYTEWDRLWRWKRLVKVAWCLLSYVQRRNFFLTKMPLAIRTPESSADEFEFVNPKASSSQAKQKSAPWKVLTFQSQKWIVGKELPEGQGKKDATKHTHDPLTCQHPSENTRGRGGRNELRWWICLNCGTRWERIPLSEYETDSPGHDKDFITFGKHLGKTYETVLRTDPPYCQWALQTVESGDSHSPQLKKFAKYVVSKDNRGVTANYQDIPAGRMDEEL